MNGLMLIQMVLQVIGLMAIGSAILNVVEIPDFDVTVKEQNPIRWTYVRIRQMCFDLKKRFKKEQHMAEVVDLAAYRTRRVSNQIQPSESKSA
ncbi:hypothetical protein [Bdellovibrio sp. BCCA]|uniref:hypothetical protein n=1 Tax=Bdellovibrio sp. BCCA TaxID=3136281 RepID=UPI0030F290BD